MLNIGLPKTVLFERSVQAQRKSAVSPEPRMLRRERTTEITSEAKTFNNYMNFEHGL
jgi:hypothetical protein